MSARGVCNSQTAHLEIMASISCNTISCWSGLVGQGSRGGQTRKENEVSSLSSEVVNTDKPVVADATLFREAVSSPDDQVLDGSLCNEDMSENRIVNSAPDATFMCTPFETNCCDTNRNENRIFIAESRQLVKFVDEVNDAACLVADCSGKLQLHSVEQSGMGGAACFAFRCSSCGGRKVNFDSSSQRENGSPALSAALQVAFICAGASYAQYKRVLRHFFGMQCVSSNTFYRTIEKMHGHVKTILDDICLEARQQMKDMDQGELGSWSRAVTCADAVWLTRGHYSRNGTFTVRNNMTGALLYYYHICQKGKDKLCDEDVYKGTSKSAEGFGADRVFSLMDEDGINVECHVQDGDSTAGNALLKYFPNCHLLRCGNHVAKNHAVRLDKLRKEKKMTCENGSEVECYCRGKKHASKCGCISEKFIKKAKSTFQMCLTKAGKDPNAFSERLMNLALYHYRDVHEWDGGYCDFHPLVVCSCGSCKDKNNLNCVGKPYKTGHVLDCPFHSLAYELECREMAAQADVLIHPEIGNVTTNIVEASHNVLVRYRSKDWNIARLHYQVSTNLGLIQSCMTNLYTKRGPQYHWILDVLKCMDLPEVPNLKYILKELNEDRFLYLQNQKTDEAKSKRKLYKKHRKVDEHQARMLFVQKSAMMHNYGFDEDEAQTSIKKCKCGSTDHMRTNHRSCPLNNGRKTIDEAPANDDMIASSDENVSETDSELLDYDDVQSAGSDDVDLYSCTCPNYPRHKWYCPDNVRNRKRANDGSITPSRSKRNQPPLSLLPSQDNIEQSTPAVNVTPSGTFWTPPLRSMDLTVVKCHSPLSLSQYRKEQGTPAVNVTPSSNLLLPSLRAMNLTLVKCPSPLIPSQVRCQSTPAVNVSLNDSTAQNVNSSTACTIPNKTMELLKRKCPSPVISNIKEQSIPVSSFHGKRSSPLISSTNGSAVKSNHSECFVDDEKTKAAQKVVHEMLPPPSTNEKWVQEAVSIISKFSGMEVVRRKDPVKQIPCSEIAPHIRDKIVGDGACFFRTLSKAITGTEANHYPVRMSLIKFMLHPANVLAFGRFLRQGVNYDKDALKAVTSHINRCRLYAETSWSTEYEVFAAATMFQVKINVFSEYSDHRDWHTFVPRFTNETCMTPMQVMLYLYHINGNHYDLVIPVFN